MALTLTTELEAVNMMLETIGEQPVNTLTVSGLADVAMAKQRLKVESRKVQASGWDFNTDIKFRLVRDTNNQIPRPTDALRIDVVGSSVDIVERGSFLYNRDTNSFTFTEDYDFDIVRFLNFEDLPEAARFYIAVRASRVFQRRVLGDDAIEAFTQDEEFEARILLEDADSETADRSLLNDPVTAHLARANRSRELRW